jgi:uridine kinase
MQIYVDANEDVRFQRRMDRDTKERGRSAESVVAQINATVLPMHKQFVEPTRIISDFVITNNQNDLSQLRELAKQALSLIVALLYPGLC